MRTTLSLVLLAGLGVLGLSTGCESEKSARAGDRVESFDPIVAFKPGLRAELLEIRAEDQALRAEIARTPESGRRELFVQILESNDRNVERLKEIIDHYGWPTISMVGKDGSEAAWLIAQHADRDPMFRERCLGLMQEAAEKGEASRAHLAYLVDRVMVEVSQQQFYGTQFWEGPDGYGPAPIIDRANLEERRADAGLVSFEDYQMAMTARRPGAALAEDEDADGPPENAGETATASADPDG